MLSFIRCSLLIVTAIQGITPDKRDIASPLAIELLFPTEHNPSGFLDHNDSQGDVCEAAQRRLADQLRQKSRPSPFERLKSAGMMASDSSWESKSAIRAGEQPPRCPNILLALCRLLC